MMPELDKQGYRRQKRLDLSVNGLGSYQRGPNSKKLETVVSEAWHMLVGSELDDTDSTDIDLGWKAGLQLEQPDGKAHRVILRAGKRTARYLAAQMLPLDADAVEPEIVRDALGEFVNVVAGNLLPHYPAGTTPSLPEIETLTKENTSEVKPLAQVEVSSARGDIAVQIMNVN